MMMASPTGEPEQEGLVPDRLQSPVASPGWVSLASWVEGGRLVRELESRPVNRPTPSDSIRAAVPTEEVYQTVPEPVTVALGLRAAQSSTFR